MATEYVYVGRSAAGKKLFHELRDYLGFESYPNGQSGWTDRAHKVFEHAGFVRRGYSKGCPALAGYASFDFTGASVKTINEARAAAREMGKAWFNRDGTILRKVGICH